LIKTKTSRLKTKVLIPHDPCLATDITGFHKFPIASAAIEILFPIMNLSVLNNSLTVTTGTVEHPIAPPNPMIGLIAHYISSYTLKTLSRLEQVNQPLRHLFKQTVAHCDINLTVSDGQ